MDGKAPILIPHMPRLAKSLFSKYRIRQQLWGLVNFGRKEYEFFPYFDWWKHDPNLTLSFFWKHLSRVLSESTESFDVLLSTLITAPERTKIDGCSRSYRC